MKLRYLCILLFVTCCARSTDLLAAESQRPALPASKLRTLTGGNWEVTSRRGQIVVLDFWSLNCGPCLAMVPKLRKLQSEWKDRQDVQLIGVPTDDDLLGIRRHVKRHRMNWPHVIDQSGSALAKLAGPLGIDSMPTPNFWIIDAEGRIAGSTTDLTKARKAAEQLALNAKAKKETKD